MNGTSGEPGQRGQEGVGPGGRGGHGGEGGTGQEGERGPTGPVGPRGPQRAYGPVYGYLAASLIFTCVVYGLLFQQRHELVQSCERVNVLRTQFNARAEPLHKVIKVLMAARMGPDAIPRSDPHADAHEVKLLENADDLVTVVPITACHKEFPPPWPFG